MKKILLSAAVVMCGMTGCSRISQERWHNVEVLHCSSFTLDLKFENGEVISKEFDYFGKPDCEAFPVGSHWDMTIANHGGKTGDAQFVSGHRLEAK